MQTPHDQLCGPASEQLHGGGLQEQSPGPDILSWKSVKAEEQRIFSVKNLSARRVHRVSRLPPSY